MKDYLATIHFYFCFSKIERHSQLLMVRTSTGFCDAAMRAKNWAKDNMIKYGAVTFDVDMVPVIE